MAGYLLSSGGPGLTVSSSNSNATLAVGDTISISAGTATRVTAGSTASLAMGPTTSINLGSTLSFTAAANVSFSASKTTKIYATDKVETAASSESFATGANVLKGGTLPANAANVAAMAKRKQVFLALLGATLSLAATIGGSIYGLSNPPFTVASDNSSYTSSWSGLEIAITTVVTTLVQVATTLYLFQSMDITPVSTLTLDNSGFNLATQSDALYPSTFSIVPRVANPGIVAAPAKSVLMTLSSEDTAKKETGLITLESGAINLSTVNTTTNSTQSINLNQGGALRIKNTSSADQTSQLTFEPDGSSLTDNKGIMLNVGANANIMDYSSLYLEPTQAALSCANSTGEASVIVTPTSVTIGTGANNAVFSSTGIKVGNDININSNSVNLGDGSLVIKKDYTDILNANVEAVNAQVKDNAEQLKQRLVAMELKLTEQAKINNENESLIEKLRQANEKHSKEIEALNIVMQN